MYLIHKNLTIRGGVKMKKIILICIIMVFGTINTSFSTPIHDYHTNTDEILILNDSIQPTQFTFNEYAPVSLEDINSNSQKDMNDNPTLVFNTWTPSWSYHRFDWNNFKNLFGGFFRCPRPSPGDNPSPVPEPATILLFGSGLIGLACIRRKNKNKSV